MGDGAPLRALEAGRDAGIATMPQPLGRARLVAWAVNRFPFEIEGIGDRLARFTTPVENIVDIRRGDAAGDGPSPLRSRRLTVIAEHLDNVLCAI